MPAIIILCCSPPDKFIPPSPTEVCNPLSETLISSSKSDALKALSIFLLLNFLPKEIFFSIEESIKKLFCGTKPIFSLHFKLKAEKFLSIETSPIVGFIIQ